MQRDPNVAYAVVQTAVASATITVPGDDRRFLVVKHRVAPIAAPGPEAWTTAVCLSLEAAEGLAEALLLAVRGARHH
jgi:hypothetical protein